MSVLFVRFGIQSVGGWFRSADVWSVVSEISSGLVRVTDSSVRVIAAALVEEPRATRTACDPTLRTVSEEAS